MKNTDIINSLFIICKTISEKNVLQKNSVKDAQLKHAR